MWSGIQAAVKSAEADLGEFPDSAVLGAPATSQDDLTAKREMHGVIQQYMLGAQRIDDWLAKGTTADGTRWRRPARRRCSPNWTCRTPGHQRMAVGARHG